MDGAVVGVDDEFAIEPVGVLERAGQTDATRYMFLIRDTLDMSRENLFADFSLFQHAEKRSMCPAQAFLTTSHRGGTDRQRVFFLNGDREMYIRPQFNLKQIVSAGQAGGRLNLAAMNKAVGHYGTFDFQRVRDASGNTTFYSGYTPVSNISVGAYLFGTGFSETQAGYIANTFAKLFSSNAGDPQQTVFRNLGYEVAAGKGSYTCSATPR